MLIPSIDLMDGKIVQLVQGERKALEFDDFSQWTDRFRKFPIVQLIDLDAAKSTGNNRGLVRELCTELPCQVGGGLRSIESVRQVLASRAKKVIIGSSLFSDQGINKEFAEELVDEFGADHLIFAVDSRAGFVSVKGWKQSTNLRPAQAMRELEQFCSAFLYTHIDTEGTMQGFPFAVLNELRNATTKKLIVAGGITTRDEVEQFDALGIDAVVGMAIYTAAMRV